MDQQKMIGVAITAGILYAAYKFIPNAAVKAMALGVGGVIVAKQLPYLRDQLA